MRMDDNELPKKMLWTNPEGQRGPRSPKSICTDGVEEDAMKLVRGNGRADAQVRLGCWRHMLEEARAHPGLYSR